MSGRVGRNQTTSPVSSRINAPRCPGPEEGDRNRDRSDPPLRRTTSRGGRRSGRERKWRTSFGDADVAPAASSGPRRRSSDPALPNKTSPRAPPDTRRTKSARVVRASPVGDSASTSNTRCCDLGEMRRSNHDWSPSGRALICQLFLGRPKADRTSRRRRHPGPGRLPAGRLNEDLEPATGKPCECRAFHSCPRAALVQGQLPGRSRGLFSAAQRAPYWSPLPGIRSSWPGWLFEPGL